MSTNSIPVYASWDTSGEPLISVEEMQKRFLDDLERHGRGFDNRFLFSLVFDYHFAYNYKLLCDRPIKWHCSNIPEGFSLSYDYTTGERYVLRNGEKRLSILLYIEVKDCERWEFFDLHAKEMLAEIYHKDMDEFNRVLHDYFTKA